MKTIEELLDKLEQEGCRANIHRLQMEGLKKDSEKVKSPDDMSEREFEVARFSRTYYFNNLAGAVWMAETLGKINEKERDAILKDLKDKYY